MALICFRGQHPGSGPKTRAVSVGIGYSEYRIGDEHDSACFRRYQLGLVSPHADTPP